MIEATGAEHDAAKHIQRIVRGRCELAGRGRAIPSCARIEALQWAAILTVCAALNVYIRMVLCEDDVFVAGVCHDISYTDIADKREKQSTKGQRHLARPPEGCAHNENTDVP